MTPEQFDELMNNQFLFQRKVIYRLTTIQEQLNVLSPVGNTPTFVKNKERKLIKIKTVEKNYDKNDWMKASECCQFLKISQSKLSVMAGANEIPFAFDKNGHRLFSKKELHKWILHRI